MTKRYKSGKRPVKCPKCGSKRIAKILYGEPAYSEELQADLKAGRIVLGGCIFTGDDPQWKCLDCETEIFGKN